MLIQSLPRPLPAVASRPCSAAAMASSERPTRCSASARFDQALVRSKPTGETAIASRRLALPSSTSPSRMSESPIALSASARGPASASLAAASAARADGSTSLKRPCSIAILAWRERIRARSGLWSSSSGSSSTARVTDARASSARPSDHWERDTSSSSPAATRGSRSSSTSPIACLSSASARACEPSLMSARLARRTSSMRSQPICSIASGHPRPQVERALEQRARLAVGVDALGGVGGAHGRDERLALAAGREVVVGDAGGDDRVLAGLGDLGLERAGEREVQLGVLARQQVVVDDLAQQRVPELVATAGVGDDHVGLRRLAHHRAQLGAAEATRVGEHVVREDARGREQPQHLLRRLAQALDPHHQRVAQRRRQPAAAVEPRREQLLGEQRVALAAGVQALDQLVVGRPAEDVGEQLAQLVARQARELDPAGARVALELGQQRAQRVPAVQLVGAVGRDHEHALGPQAAAEEGEEGARRAVGPVDVLEHERERLLAAELVEQRQQRLEQARLAARRLVRAQLLGAAAGAAPVELRQQRGELRAHARGQRVENGVTLTRERAQDAHDRCVGQLLLAELDALADRHPRAAVAGAARELGDHAGLADARLTRDEGQGRSAIRRVAQCGFELRELGHPPDQTAAGHPRSHGLSMSVRPARRGRRRHSEMRSECIASAPSGSVDIGGARIPYSEVRTP